jgi:hypothetical protein
MPHGGQVDTIARCAPDGKQGRTVPGFRGRRVQVISRSEQRLQLSNRTPLFPWSYALAYA